MSGFDDLLKNEKLQDALRSEQAEGVSDRGLDAAAAAAGRATGGRFEEQIAAAQAAADKKVGTE